MSKKDFIPPTSETVVEPFEKLVEPPHEVLAELDRLALEMSTLRKSLAEANAREALAKAELAEMSFKYLVLQVYRKYGLADGDNIDSNGNIIRNP